MPMEKLFIANAFWEPMSLGTCARCALKAVRWKHPCGGGNRGAGMKTWHQQVSWEALQGGKLRPSVTCALRQGLLHPHFSQQQFLLTHVLLEQVRVHHTGLVWASSRPGPVTVNEALLIYAI